MSAPDSALKKFRWYQNWGWIRFVIEYVKYSVQMDMGSILKIFWIYSRYSVKELRGTWRLHMHSGYLISTGIMPFVKMTSSKYFCASQVIIKYFVDNYNDISQSTSQGVPWKQFHIEEIDDCLDIETLSEVSPWQAMIFALPTIIVFFY